MKFKKFNLKHKGKKFSVEAGICNFFMKFKGLMFVRRRKAKALLFDFKKYVQIPFHSLFVFFPFLILWLNDKDEIVEYKNVKPFNFCILPKTKYTKVIEIPLNKKYVNLKHILQ